MTRLNFKLSSTDYKVRIAALLRMLLDGPKLATELPKSPNELIEAESLGLCHAECMAKHNDTTKPSVWRWSIQPSGVRWLRARDLESRQRGRRSRREQRSG